MGRHPDLGPLLPTLKWFVSALEVADEPMGTATNYDNADRHIEFVHSVPDRDPRPISAEELIAACLAGGLRYAECEQIHTQMVRVSKSEYELRPVTIPAGAVTHVFGKRVTQDTAQAERPSKSKAARADRAAIDSWFCRKLGAITPNVTRLSLGKRKSHPPIDWSKFEHVRGTIPIDDARRACGLPPRTLCVLPGLPYTPRPEMLFRGMGTRHAGKACFGSDGEVAEGRVRVAMDVDYPAVDRLIDRLTLEQFQRAHPEHFSTLSAVTTAGSMGDLVPANDNKMGKRKLVRAAEALKIFLAA